MFCLDAKTGKTVYGPQRLRPATYSASPVLADGKIYVTNEDGLTIVVKAGPKFELLAENDLGEYTLSSPAVSEGQIFIRTDKALYAIGTANDFDGLARSKLDLTKGTASSLRVFVVAFELGGDHDSPTRLTRRLAGVVAAAAVVVTAQRLVGQAEPVDLQAVFRIKDEGLRRSKVMEIASYLTDVYGPRLTGRPKIRRAGEWAVKECSGPASPTSGSSRGPDSAAAGSTSAFPRT